MTRPLGPLPADDLGDDLQPVWDRLADHAASAPHAGAELKARVQGALMTEFDRALRPIAHRPVAVVRPVVRPLFRPSSLRSLLAAAALVALLGASAALAGAGVIRLQEQHPSVIPTGPAAQEPTDEPDRSDPPAPIIVPPAHPGPDGIEDPDENVAEPTDDGGTPGDEVDPNGPDATPNVEETNGPEDETAAPPAEQPSGPVDNTPDETSQPDNSQDPSDAPEADLPS